MTNYGPNVKDKGRSRCKVECSKRDDLKDDTHRRPQHREVHRMHRRLQVEVHTNSSKYRPFIEKNRLFVEIFLLEDLELSKVFHIFALRKDIHTLIHTFIHTIECFSKVRDIYNQRASSNDRRRKAKNWNVSRHRHEHNT